MEVEVVEDEVTTVELELKRGREAPHTNKDGLPVRQLQGLTPPRRRAGEPIHTRTCLEPARHVLFLRPRATADDLRR